MIDNIILCFLSFTVHPVEVCEPSARQGQEVPVSGQVHQWREAVERLHLRQGAAPGRRDDAQQQAPVCKSFDAYISIHTHTHIHTYLC